MKESTKDLAWAIMILIITFGTIACIAAMPFISMATRHVVSQEYTDVSYLSMTSDGGIVTVNYVSDDNTLFFQRFGCGYWPIELGENDSFQKVLEKTEDYLGSTGSYYYYRLTLTNETLSRLGVI